MYDLTNIFEVFLPQLLTYPNAADPLNGEAATLQLREPERYRQKVIEYVQKYAKPEDFPTGTSNDREKDDEDDGSNFSISDSEDEGGNGVKLGDDEDDVVDLGGTVGERGDGGLGAGSEVGGEAGNGAVLGSKIGSSVAEGRNGHENGEAGVTNGGADPWKR